MKKRRHEAICNIIRTNDIDTQATLADMLRERGFNVAQTTVSRDIQELKLMKVPLSDGSYKYIIPGGSPTPRTEQIAIFERNLLNVTCAENIIVFTTQPAAASLVAKAMDSLVDKRILGTIAGYDTVFAVSDSSDHAQYICSEMKQYIKIKT